MSVPAPANQTATAVEGSVSVIGVPALAATELAQASTAAATQITPTLTGTSATTVFVGGFMVDGLGATAGSVIAVTLSGLLGGSQVFRVTIPAGVTVALAGARLVVEFARPIPASAVNTPIVLTVPSFGTGNTVANAAIHGFYR